MLTDFETINPKAYTFSFKILIAFVVFLFFCIPIRNLFRGIDSKNTLVPSTSRSSTYVLLLLTSHHQFLFLFQRQLKMTSDFPPEIDQFHSMQSMS